MKIAHIAIWVRDLERSKRFYETYFGAKAGDKYVNPAKNFSSYFLSFEGGCRLEIMHKPEIPESPHIAGTESLGLTHFAISLGSAQNVDQLTMQLEQDGYKVVGKPRRTGDGYYESVVLDPENNRIEITE